MSEYVERYRFDRRGRVVRERRRFGPTFGTDGYAGGDPIFAPRRSSPAREQYREARRARRRAAWTPSA